MNMEMVTMESNIRTECPVCGSKLVMSSGGGVNNRDCPKCGIRIIPRDPCNSRGFQYCYGCKRDMMHSGEYIIKDGKLICFECAIKGGKTS